MNLPRQTDVQRKINARGSFETQRFFFVLFFFCFLFFFFFVLFFIYLFLAFSKFDLK